MPWLNIGRLHSSPVDFESNSQCFHTHILGILKCQLSVFNTEHDFETSS